MFIVEVNQDGSVVNITPGPLYLQELNSDEAQTLLENTDNSYCTAVSDSLCTDQVMTGGYDISHITNPCMFTTIIQLVLLFYLYLI